MLKIDDANNHLVTIDGAPIPTTAPSSLALTIKVTSNTLGASASATYDFTILINQAPPQWMNNPAASIYYDASDVNAIGANQRINLNTLITQNTTNLSFNLQSQPNWFTQQGSDGNWYLVRSSQGKTDLSDIGKVIPVTVMANNSTSASSVQGVIQVTVLADSTIPAPVWSGTLSPATVAQPYDFDLLTLVSNPEYTDDTYQFTTVDISALPGSGWTVTPEEHLVNPAVPTAVSDPGISLPVNIAVTSVNSGHSPSPNPQTFNLAINNVLPVWDPNPPIPYNNWQIPFDSIAQGSGMDLTGLITTQDATGFTFADKTTRSGNWIIVQDSGGDYYLRRAIADNSDIW